MVYPLHISTSSPGTCVHTSCCTIGPASLVRTFTLFSLIFLLLAGDVLAQRNTYQSLRMRDRQPAWFVDHIYLPGNEPGSAQLVSAFRMEYAFLNFRRYHGEQSGEDRNFFAEPSVQISLYDATRSENQESAGVVASGRWNESVFSSTFEQAGSSTQYLEGVVTTRPPAGRYRIETQVTSDARTRRHVEPAFVIGVQEHAEQKARFVLLDEQSDDPLLTATLMNMGDNVFFGRNFQVAVWLPAASEQVGELQLHVEQLRVQRRDTSVVDQVYIYDFTRDRHITGHRARISMAEDKPLFELVEDAEHSDMGSWYVLPVPNSRFENAPYRMTLYQNADDEAKTVLARRTYQSLWIDMPISLLNLDVALDMMRFILDDQTHRDLRRGSRQNREQQFRAFWKARDPSPEKEYNELMVEYFRRIDYAWEQFTTPQGPGYESAQGRVYLLHGEPRRRERVLPPGQPARELWYYADRTFVFEATTGFGDYVLIEQR